MTPLWFWEDEIELPKGWYFPLVFCNPFLRWCMFKGWAEVPGRRFIAYYDAAVMKK
jgi:hypothetical protein